MPSLSSKFFSLGKRRFLILSDFDNLAFEFTFHQLLLLFVYEISLINTILSFPGSLPVVLLLSTLATLAVSWLITVAGPVRLAVIGGQCPLDTGHVTPVLTSDI